MAARAAQRESPDLLREQSRMDYRHMCTYTGFCDTPVIEINIANSPITASSDRVLLFAVCRGQDEVLESAIPELINIFPHGAIITLHTLLLAL